MQNNTPSGWDHCTSEFHPNLPFYSHRMSSEKLDVNLCQAMAKLVDELTTTGKPVLDQKQMNDFKKICKYGSIVK